MNDKMHPQDWRPSAGLRVLQLRARVLHFARAFFAQRQVLEVETPLLCSTANPDPHIENFTTTYVGPQAAQGMDLYLQSSPEFAMKRLLSAGSGPIFQICKSFRQAEWGAQHNPEFTILEWYRPGFDIAALMSEIEALMHGLFENESAHGVQNLQTTQIISYQEAFLSTLGIDPLNASLTELMDCVKHQGVNVYGMHSEGRDAWLDVLMSHCVQPRLGHNRLTFVSEYPVSQAALARINPHNPKTALRFELFLDGVELANGFHELANAEEQRIRFQQDLAVRKRHNQPQPPMDEYLLQALAKGLPDCSGVAVGLDRVIMRLAQATQVNDVMAFPFGRV
ncbi:MAG: EF-P lysine aminoacylase GenX [Gammaproteobacteria bacterium]|nr:EF-P lysine aminoacylase GenX [Gammaproteobacteria bacterium]